MKENPEYPGDESKFTRNGVSFPRRAGGCFLVAGCYYLSATFATKEQDPYGTCYAFEFYIDGKFLASVYSTKTTAYAEEDSQYGGKFVWCATLTSVNDQRLYFTKAVSDPTADEVETGLVEVKAYRGKLVKDKEPKRAREEEEEEDEEEEEEKVAKIQKLWNGTVGSTPAGFATSSITSSSSNAATQPGERMVNAKTKRLPPNTKFVSDGYPICCRSCAYMMS